MKKLPHILFELVNKNVQIYPLVVFRIVFGALLFFSTIRFWLNGWIETNYIEPSFHFKYFGFGWVDNPGELIVYTLFVTCLLSSLGIMLGLFYRLSTILFFLCFTYIELIDATYYLNHYYFVSLITLLMVFLPANRYRSLDVWFGFAKRKISIKAWAINIIKFQLVVVYFYAGIAKLNTDWLFDAMPLKIWLAAHTSTPLIGTFMDDEWVAYAFSYGGAIFDICIPFLLLYKPTRVPAYFFVIVFHLLTGYLFPIGVFPYVMICSTIIFFNSQLHQKLLFASPVIKNNDSKGKTKKNRNILLTSYVIFQLLFPFRYLLYQNDLFWTEQGYRFSWRVMLMEKSGYAQFKVHPFKDYRFIVVENDKYLSPIQEKMMSTQPDFILQYAHYLSDIYSLKFKCDISIKADSYVSINGKGSQRYVKKDVDLVTIKNSLKPITWLEDYED